MPFAAGFVENRVEGVHQFRAAAVIQRQDEPHAGVRGGEPHALLHVRPHRLGKIIGAADEQQANIVLLHGRHFALQILPQQAHQKIHFGLRPAPVFQRKGV